MKRIFIILNCLCAICVASYAQRLNDLGLKMVKEFTVQSYRKGQPSEATKYIFGYDNNNKMISLDIYKNGDLKESYKNENRIFRKYQNDLSDFLKYKFSYDVYGNITSFEYVCLDVEDGKPNYKHIYTFEYEFDNTTNQHRLSRMRNDYSEYERSTKKYIDINSWVCGKVIDIGGLYIDGSVVGKGRGFYEIDYDHPNDTNMSFYGILTSGIGYRSMYFDSLLLTEWINVRSPYFAKYTTDFHELYFHYDDNGNLIQVDKTVLGEIVWVINIEYLE